MVAVNPGPVITRLELELAPGVKGKQINNLAVDLARSLSVVSVRVVDVIPGKSVIGLEIPNEFRERVSLGELLSSEAYEKMRVSTAFGPGQGHQRPARGDGSEQDAALADGRHHGVGEIRGHQRHHHEPVVQVHGPGHSPDHDRPENRGIVRV